MLNLRPIYRYFYSSAYRILCQLSVCLYGQRVVSEHIVTANGQSCIADDNNKVGFETPTAFVKKLSILWHIFGGLLAVIHTYIPEDDNKVCVSRN
jgi:hypothetical protein